MLKLTIDNIGGQVIKDNETYLLKDNTTLTNLIVSSTELRAFQSTRGHSHAGQEEVYTFVKGTGTIEIDGTTYPAAAGDVFLIPDGAFHKVHNCSGEPLYFVCVFQGTRRH